MCVDTIETLQGIKQTKNLKSKPNTNNVTLDFYLKISFCFFYTNIWMTDVSLQHYLSQYGAGIYAIFDSSPHGSTVQMSECFIHALRLC